MPSPIIIQVKICRLLLLSPKKLGDGICILPGIEVAIKEEAHVLAYFPTLEGIKDQFLFFKDYQFIHGSDAHRLEDIAEREYFLELEDMQA